jgi:hypothetical protein
MAYKTNKNLNYKIISQSGSDHFYRDDVEWLVVEVKTGKQIMFFHGTWMGGDQINSVKFSEDGKEVIAKDGHGEIVEIKKLPAPQ